MKEKNARFSPTVLQEFEIFSTLTGEEVDQFCRVIRTQKYERGQSIIAEGDVGDSLLILLEGEVEVTQALTLKTSQTQLDTREKSLISLESEKHPFFGEMSLFSDDDKRSANVKAVSLCELGIISRADFFHICNTHPAIGNKVMQNVARVLTRRLKKTNMNVLKLTTAFSLMLEK